MTQALGSIPDPDPWMPNTAILVLYVLSRPWSRSRTRSGNETSFELSAHIAAQSSIWFIGINAQVMAQVMVSMRDFDNNSDNGQTMLCGHNRQSMYGVEIHKQICTNNEFFQLMPRPRFKKEGVHLRYPAECLLTYTIDR